MLDPAQKHKGFFFCTVFLCVGSTRRIEQRRVTGLAVTVAVAASEMHVYTKVPSASHPRWLIGVFRDACVYQSSCSLQTRMHQGGVKGVGTVVSITLSFPMSGDGGVVTCSSVGTTLTRDGEKPGGAATKNRAPTLGIAGESCSPVEPKKHCREEETRRRHETHRELKNWAETLGRQDRRKRAGRARNNASVTERITVTRVTVNIGERR